MTSTELPDQAAAALLVYHQKVVRRTVSVLLGLVLLGAVLGAGGYWWHGEQVKQDEEQEMVDDATRAFSAALGPARPPTGGSTAADISGGPRPGSAAVYASIDNEWSCSTLLDTYKRYWAAPRAPTTDSYFVAAADRMDRLDCARW